MLRRAGPIALLLLGLIAAAGLWKREEIVRVMAVQSLFAPDRIVQNFSHMDALFHRVDMEVEGAPAPLPEGPALPLPDDWQAWLDRRSVTGIVVLHDGTRVHESYHLGTGRDDQRISWSVAKSYLSALFGILVAEGHIPDLDAQVVDLVPELEGSAYDGVRIRDLLMMTTGVGFDEDYLDFWSDINKMGRVLALGGSMDGFAASLDQKAHPPGTHWAYVSIDTHVLGMVARAATGRDLPELMAEKVLQPLGTYGDPYYLADGYGTAFALGGMNMTTRDYARLGEMFRQHGQFEGRQIVPAAWVDESVRPLAPTPAGQMGYGYQWWVPADARAGEFMAQGVYGQFIYVDRQSATVVAINGADRQFQESGALDDALDMMRRLRAGRD